MFKYHNCGGGGGSKWVVGVRVAGIRIIVIEAGLGLQSALDLGYVTGYYQCYQ